jgi:type VI secretion system secreted protein Hcp
MSSVESIAAKVELVDEARTRLPFVLRGEAMAASDYFLRIDGVPGESADSKHNGEIELESFTWGETNSAGHPGPGAGAGKVSLQDLSFVMRFNKASPMLFLACANGKHLKSAVLTARKAGKPQQDFLVYRFTDVLVSSYQTGGSADVADGPIDQVSLSFARIEVEYRSQKPDGSLDAPVKAGWDVKKNAKI